VDLGLWEAKVLITGASRGIGREIARHYAESGADVVITCTGSPAPVVAR
jgi:NAD(P)-dependent dehydrogenase (short-subunit alcohol dehydrogenase family)